MGIPLLLIKSFKKPQIKKFIKQTPPKSRNSDSKYTLEIFKNQKSNSKQAPQFKKFSKTKNLTQKHPQKLQKIKNIYEEASNKKSFIKDTPPKVVILIQNKL